MKIRNGRPSDLEAFFEMWWQSSIEHINYNVLDRTKEKDVVKKKVIEAQRKCMKKKGNIFLIAEMDNGDVIGVATGHVGGRDEPVFIIDKEGFVDEIYVLEKYRGMGIGKKLLDELIQRLRVQGAPFIGLAVAVQNPAIGFYQKQGFIVKSHWMVK